MAESYDKLALVCGRFTLTVPTFEDLREALGLDVEVAASDVASHRPRFNIAPTDRTWIVTLDGDAPTARLTRWGLDTRRSEEDRPGRPIINLRAESLKPNGRDLGLAANRCVVLADGFYEWRAGDADKRPHYFRPEGAPLLLLTGVFSERVGPRAFSIVTTRARDDVAPIHHRMPRLLDRNEAQRWLGGEGLRDLLTTTPTAPLRVVRVTTRANAVRNDDAACLTEDG